MSLQVFRLGGVERFCESRGVNVAARAQLRALPLVW